VSADRLEAGRAPVTPRRVLVKETNWLGDVVISLPALRAVRDAFPDATLAVLVKDHLASFFDGTPWVDEVIPYTLAPGVRRVRQIGRIVADIRARRFDLAVLFPSSFASALWAFLAGVPERVGWARDARRPLLTRAPSPADDVRRAHQVHWYLGLLEATLGIVGGSAAVAPGVHAPHRARMAAWLAAARRRPGGRLIALAPGAAYGPAKEWPAAHYATLVDLLAERHGAECVLVGAPAERERCEAVAAASHGALVAAGETSVGELVALLSLAQGFAGNDSGAMHVAGALGRPTVGIFGSTSPARTGPLGPRTRVLYDRIACSPCLAPTCRFGHYDCLGRIAPETVLHALGDLGALS
jgi:heptosyltransferase-2